MVYPVEDTEKAKITVSEDKNAGRCVLNADLRDESGYFYAGVKVPISREMFEKLKEV